MVVLVVALAMVMAVVVGVVVVGVVGVVVFGVGHCCALRREHMRLRMARQNAPMNIPLNTRFSQRFGLSCPIALAPMALAAGGALAAACARAGARGLVGGGYGELAWTQREYALAQAQSGGDSGRVGCGFIVWKLDQDASALDWVL